MPRLDLIDLDGLQFDNLTITDHFGVFEDAFMPGVFFNNTQPFSVEYPPADEGPSLPVHFGNTIKTSNAKIPPQISIGKVSESETEPTEGPMWYGSIMMLNLEGNGLEEKECQTECDKSPKYKGQYKYAHQSPLDEQSTLLECSRRKQVLHWFVGNISSDSGGKLEDGEAVVPYLQPIAFHGTGYHRIVFFLFRHREKLDFSRMKLHK
jgi:hypothetical protein